MEEIKCDICGKIFKSLSGLEGHKRLSHSEQTKKTYPDEIGKRLAALEAMAAAGINPGTVVDSEEKVIDKLKLLLSAIEKYQLTVGNLGQRTGFGFISDPEYRIVRNSDLEHSGIGGQCLKAKAKEL